MGIDFDALRSYIMLAVAVFAAIPIVAYVLKKLVTRIMDILLPAEVFAAEVVGKRIKVETKDKKVRTLYFVTFELEQGDRPEFQLEAEQYAKHAEGDRGELCLRKGQMVSFTRG